VNDERIDLKIAIRTDYALENPAYEMAAPQAFEEAALSSESLRHSSYPI